VFKKRLPHRIVGIIAEGSGDTDFHTSSSPVILLEHINEMIRINAFKKVPLFHYKPHLNKKKGGAASPL
jgi:hypothetical protein